MLKNLILIITDKNDRSSLEVISYLHSKDNETCILSPDSETSINNLFKFKSLCKEANGIWLRRGNLPSSKINVAFTDEYKTFNRYYHHLLEQHPNSIGSLVKEYEHNKLIDLEIAQSCGLTIPFSTIVSTRVMLESLFEANSKKDFITKGFYNPVTLKKGSTIQHYGSTLLINKQNITRITDYKFFPSLIQERIDKKLEVRTFYVKGEIYSMAIFSQGDEQTELDYRNYNEDRQNRNVPYQLPSRVEESIVRFMKKSNLNSGSLDLILGRDGKYYFLEVNPVGQFGWVSTNCNYYLEKRISELLTTK